MEQQQIMGQQEQMTNPQMGQQQMMLCPVRLVYESPMLMQQGDQMQQNQAIFLNPQNPPPWMRPVQNQVIYVQQIPNNMMPIQQAIDPNMYVQQNFVYPQMIPQQIFTQNPQEQIRFPLQMPNMMPQNVIHNFQQNNQLQQVNNHNIQAQNVQTVPMNTQNLPDEKPVVAANYAQVQVNVNAPNSAQNQFNILHNRQIVNSIQSQNIGQNLFVNQGIPQIQQQVTPMVVTQKIQEVQKHPTVVNRNIAPQINQQQIRQVIPRQQVPQSMSEMQNLQNVQNVQSNQQINQTFVPNIRPMVQPIRPNMPNVQQTYINPLPNIRPAVERQIVPNTESEKAVNGPTVSYTAVRNGQSYTYRAIQPRPPQYRNMPTLLPMGVPSPPLGQRPNAPSNNQVNPNKNVVPSTTMAQVKTENASTNTVSRKRKSESPDEVQTKVSAANTTTVYGSMTVTSLPPNSVYSTANVIAVNGVPIPSNDLKGFVNQPHMLQIKPMTTQMSNMNQDPNTHVVPVVSAPVTQIASKPDPTIDSKNIANLIEKEKLIRNTVFTQARGRMLNAKTPQHNVKPETNLSRNEFTTTVSSDIHYLKKDQSFHTNIPPNPIAKTDKQEIVKQDAKPMVPPKTNDVFMKPLPVTDKCTKQTEASAKKANINKSEQKMDISTNTYKEKNKDIEKKPVINTEKETKSTIKPFEAYKIKPEPTPKIANPVKEKVNVNNIPITPAKNSHLSKLIELLNNPQTTDIKSENTRNLIPKIEEMETEQTEIDLIKTETKVVEKDLEHHKVKEIKHELNSKLSPETVNNELALKNKKEYKHLSINDVTGREIHMVDGNVVKNDKDFILTHVLDGFVIQESNVPFAIRKPLKEKALQINKILSLAENAEVKAEETVAVREKTENDSAIENDTEQDSVLNENEVKEDEGSDKNSNKQILEISQLNLDEREKQENSQEQSVEQNNSDNPFGPLQKTTVQTWTMDELTSHLSKYNWTETITMFKEHEIDGESLFLVSKEQLLHIGVNEAHADLICNFVGC